MFTSLFNCSLFCYFYLLSKIKFLLLLLLGLYGGLLKVALNKRTTYKLCSQIWTWLCMKIRPGSSRMEAFCGSGHSPAWGMPTMTMNQSKIAHHYFM